jgi:dihydrofolate reductase
MIKVIVAVAENGVIGKNNGIPWREPNDLKYFKKMTLGSPIIMGRKTFDSLPGILPGRLHVIVSRTMIKAPEGCKLYDNLNKALDAYPDCFVIGGANIYDQVLPIADELYLTEVKGKYEGDTLFPGVPRDYNLVEEEKEGNLTFKMYNRKK